MRRIFLIIVLAVFIYSLFRDMSVVRALILCAGVVGAFAVSRIPLKHIAVMRYPVIGLCLALTGGLLLYAPLRSYQVVRYACPVLAFFAASFFLATLDEKAKKPVHEIVGLSLILLSSGYNLAISQHTGLLLPLTVSTALFLFVLSRNRLLPVVACFAAMVVAFLYLKKVAVFGGSLSLNGIERYVVLGSAFTLLLVAFIGVVRKAAMLAMLPFFALLCISIDLLLSVGFKFRGLMLYQPLVALFIVGPVVGLMMKEEGERA